MDVRNSKASLFQMCDNGARWRARGLPLVASIRGELTDLLVAAQGMRQCEDVGRPEDIVDYASAHRALRDLWDQAAEVVAEAGASATRLSKAIDLLRKAKELDERIMSARLENRDVAFRNVRNGLELLRTATSTAKLIDIAPAAVSSLGFDRAIISRIDDSQWLPEKVHVEHDSRWADEILEIGRACPQLLDGSLVETEIIRRRKSLLVDRVQERQGVHRPIADASLSRSYTAAPIVVNDSVIGFLHADCYHQQRDVDELDRQVLAMFGEGLGQAMARTAALDHLAAIRAEVEKVTAFPGVSSGFGHPGASACVDITAADHAHVGASAWSSEGEAADHQLTRREVDVLRLMASGHTNARIARRLVISDGTVKSHVKHILRKLGAANRAEAVSYWYRMTR